MHKPRSKLFARLVNCFDSAGNLCPIESRPNHRSRMATPTADYLDPGFTPHESHSTPYGMRGGIPGRGIQIATDYSQARAYGTVFPSPRFTVRADAPHAASSSCNETDLNGLPATVQSAALKALPALVTGSAPAIIEIRKIADAPKPAPTNLPGIE